MESLVEKIPHRNYCVLVTFGDGAVEVLGEDEIVTRVRAALDTP